MRGIVLLLLFVAGGYQLSISEFSVPQAVEVGENVTLTCDYELLNNETDKALFVKWWWNTYNNGTIEYRHQLYQRIAGHPPEVTRKDISIIGNDDILLENVTVGDSGRYECEVSNIDEVRKHGELVIYKLGSGPELNITVNVTADGPDQDTEEDMSIVVKCEANDVAPAPSLKITVNGNAVEGEENLMLSEEDSYNVENTVVLSKENADEAEIICQLVIEELNMTHPHTEVQIFYINSTARTTAGDADDLSTTEASSLQYTSGAEFIPTSSIVLVITTFLFHLF